MEKDIERIKNILQELFINRYIILKNICSIGRSGFTLISKNNKHYTDIDNNIKTILEILKNTSFKENKIFKCNIKYIKYKMYHNNDEYIKINTQKIKDSLFYGINNFISYVIKLVNKEKGIEISILLDLYKDIKHNMYIVNQTLDSNYLCYRSSNDKKYFDINNKISIKIVKKNIDISVIKDEEIIYKSNNAIEIYVNPMKIQLYYKIYEINSYMKYDNKKNYVKEYSKHNEEVFEKECIKNKEKDFGRCIFTRLHFNYKYIILDKLIEIKINTEKKYLYDFLNLNVFINKLSNSIVFYNKNNYYIKLKMVLMGYQWFIKKYNKIKYFNEILILLTFPLINMNLRFLFYHFI